MPDSARLFRSSARYFDKRGPISWDMAMTGTPTNWRPAVKAGDVLRISATYETRRASWYESMGIMVVWEAYSDGTGVDPFTQALNQNGHVTHGHLGENKPPRRLDAARRQPQQVPDCKKSQVDITRFLFLPGDFTAPGGNRCTPTVRRGHSTRRRSAG